MKLMRFRHHGAVYTGVLEGGTLAPVRGDLLGIIQGAPAEPAGMPRIPLEEAVPLLPYDVPPKIWCIGLNYRSHAEDIQAVQPEEPGSFMKPASCMFPPGGEIVLPPPEISRDVDAEGELGVIIGRRCRFLEPEEVAEAIFGYTTTLDLTALDVLARNPRYLTRAKSIDTFFSFGPVVVTRDEVPDVDALEVVTELNDAVCSRDFVRNMRHRPFELVRFHSQYMTLYPGDLISTGCPKGARIRAGDRVRARIEGVGTLEARVRQLEAG
jgi:2-keto-4-pentenoate hydratase/2-oxohepta-3-ene-1,7-dioic acid hydratase in catechol pathway